MSINSRFDDTDVGTVTLTALFVAASKSEAGEDIQCVLKQVFFLAGGADDGIDLLPIKLPMLLSSSLFAGRLHAILRELFFVA